MRAAPCTFSAILTFHSAHNSRWRLSARLAADPPTKIGAWTVVDVNRVDGVKYLFDDGSWLLLRMSGTEPVVRCYAESHSEKDLEVLLETGSQFVRN